MDSFNAGDEIINKRKEKVFSFLKEKYNLVVYVVLAFIVYLSIRIRTLNLPGLKDITTGTWTLGPDLDPFLFLRYVKYIVENGSLYVIDMMRYVPIGFEMARDFRLHYYLIAWFHNLASFFGSDSVTYSAIIYPVFMFAITVIAFFLLVRKLFANFSGIKKANIIALVASFFLSIFPVLLPRTIAGIPEKESAAFFFMFMAFYFFISSWKTEKRVNKYILAVLSGVFTASMALIWGGYAFIFFILSPTILVSFLLGSVNKSRFYSVIIWTFTSLIIMAGFSAKYSFKNLSTSITTASSLIVLLIIIVHNLIYGTKIKNYFERQNFKGIPPKIISVIAAIVIIILGVSIFLGPSFIFSQSKDIYHNLVKPAQSRLIQTVAENRQPYFAEWANNFGPVVKNIPITFWIFFIGSIYLFSHLIKDLKKNEKIMIISSYTLFLVSLVFSRYSGSSILNGENFVSVSVYFIGFALFGTILAYHYYKYYKNGELDLLKKIDFGLVFVFIFFFLSIVSARGLIRLVMVLAIPGAIMISYLFVNLLYYEKEFIERKNKKIGIVIIAGIIILLVIFSGFSLYKASSGLAASYVPGGYNQQWQKAMGWVRDNVQENAVFGHWWDYGYWVQSIGERATVLDGGNAISYWNHLMGRYGLTGRSEQEALEFLYAHNTTHFLIDSTDIGKYTAFSSIGSNESYDRTSWIPTLLRDNSQTVERKNSTIEVYPGGISLDEDIIYEMDGEKIFLPSGSAAFGGVLVERNEMREIISIYGVFVYQGKQYNIPLRYYSTGDGLVDLGNGIDSSIFFMPRLDVNSAGGLSFEEDGAIVYLSRRTFDSQLARLYFYGEEISFKNVHTESDFLISDLREQGLQIGDFAYFRGFRGPIKIWEINYPENIDFKEEYLETKYPESLRIA
ncbi:MAG: STT3 domain-containing protein [Candidatus Pacearchaeota archaeon]|nr:STT3 domain-containing protein [Candidatus Pacearchaeota archaeon]